MNASQRARTRKPVRNADFEMGSLGPKGPQRPAKRKLGPALEQATGATGATGASVASPLRAPVASHKKVTDKEREYQREYQRERYAQWSDGVASRKGHWSKHEDKLLLQGVKKYNARCWSRIAEGLPGRIGKQCRERWHNHLDPSIDRSPFTQAEQLWICTQVSELGQRWATIAKGMTGRTDNAIKNWYHHHLARVWENKAEDVQTWYSHQFTGAGSKGKFLGCPAQWRIQEERRLVQATVDFGTRAVGSWEKIAAAVATRTLSACKRHWFHMRNGYGTIHKVGFSQAMEEDEDYDDYDDYDDDDNDGDNAVRDFEQGLRAHACIDSVDARQAMLLADEKYDEGSDQDVWKSSVVFVVEDPWSMGGLNYASPPPRPYQHPNLMCTSSSAEMGTETTETTDAKTPKKKSKKQKKTGTEKAAAESPPPPLSQYPLSLEAVGALVGPSVAPPQAQELCANTATLMQMTPTMPATAQAAWALFQAEEVCGTIREQIEGRVARESIRQRQDQQQAQHQVHEYYNEVKRREEGEALAKSVFV